jgi:hypothetical protein
MHHCMTYSNTIAYALECYATTLFVSFV